MQQADLAIISLASGVYHVAYPSKSMMYLAAGCPILAIVESDSELAQTVVQRQWGYVTRSFEPADIAEAIRRAVSRQIAADSWSTRGVASRQ